MFNNRKKFENHLFGCILDDCIICLFYLFIVSVDSEYFLTMSDFTFASGRGQPQQSSARGGRSGGRGRGGGHGGSGFRGRGGSRGGRGGPPRGGGRGGGGFRGRGRF